MISPKIVLPIVQVAIVTMSLFWVDEALAVQDSSEIAVNSNARIPPHQLGEMLVTYQTKEIADASVVSESVTAIQTLGYSQTGRGGGLYIYSGTEAPKYSPRGQKNIARPRSHYITATTRDGGHRYFELAEEFPNVLQFGALPGEGTDNTDSINDALSYGKEVYVPPGRYYVRGTLKILEDGTLLKGAGPGGAASGGSDLVFGPGLADCIQLGDGVNLLRWGKLERLLIDAKARSGGNAILALFNHQLVIDEMRVINPYNGIRLFRGIGFTIRNVVMSGIRAGNGGVDGPTEIGYGIKFGGAADLYDANGRRVKRNSHVLYVENLSFGSAKVETDPSNWTVGLWCAENAASVNGATLKNQNVRHAIYITRADSVDSSDPLLVPSGYRLVARTWTDKTGIYGPRGKNYPYGSEEYPAQPNTVVNLNGRFQDLTLFYVGGDFLGGEYVYNEEGAGVAIYNPHFMRSYQGNAVYMGPNARDMSIYGGQIIGAFKNGLQMDGERWHISGTQIYRHSLDSASRETHKGIYSSINVGDTSVGGDIIDCKIGNEPLGTAGRAGNTVKYGVKIEAGARGTWVQGNRFDGCLDANIQNLAGEEAQIGGNYLGPTGK